MQTVDASSGGADEPHGEVLLAPLPLLFTLGEPDAEAHLGVRGPTWCGVRDDERRPYRIEPRTEAEFRRFAHRSRHRIRVSRGHVFAVLPPSE